MSGVRGRLVSAEEYLFHIAYAYAAAPDGTPEETVARALLELICERLERDPNQVVGSLLTAEPGGRLVPPWHPDHPG